MQAIDDARIQDWQPLGPALFKEAIIKLDLSHSAAVSMVMKYNRCGDNCLIWIVCILPALRSVPTFAPGGGRLGQRPGSVIGQQTIR
jgi:hypothetical protein